MKNVFIAIGGSGTKVAEALVRLLAAGCPTKRHDGVYTSAGDTLQIWRIDPDRSSGATVSLQNCIREYEDLQKHMSDTGVASGAAGSGWAMELDTRVRNLDPLQLPRADVLDNEIKSLAGVLDSQHSGVKKRSAPLLTPFYAQKDLEVEIDRGFYQKPFIGAAVMAIFAASLRDETSPGGKEAGLTAFHNNQTNFFVCGSLHGGTGACGVPVMGRFLGTRKKQNPGWGWRIGACLLAPYCVPPQPPFQSPLQEGEEPSDRLVEELLDGHKDHPAFADLTPEKRRELVKQILNGFYANPEDMEARARQGLSYYKDYSAEYFDELYLVGKPEPDKLTMWSNGGSSQRNPLNSAETVAALSALNFFAGTGGSATQQSYMIGASTHDLNSQKMRLRHLPKYRLAPTGDEIDPEKVFLATAVLHHLILQQIRWDVPAKSWTGLDGLRQVYMSNEQKKEADRQHYARAMEGLAGAMLAVVDPGRTLGWDGSDAAQVYEYLSGEPAKVKEVSEKMARRFMRSEPKGSLDLGRSTLKMTAIEFGTWFPGGTQFSRGEYLRHVWSQLFSRAQDVM